MLPTGTGSLPHFAARSALVECVEGVPDSEVDTAGKCIALLTLKWSKALQSSLGRTLTPHEEAALLAVETSVGIALRQGHRRLAVNDTPRGAGTRPPSQTHHPNIILTNTSS